MSKLFVQMWLASSALADRTRREDGQALTEYALILGLVVVAAAAILLTIGNKIGIKLNAISGALN